MRPLYPLRPAAALALASLLLLTGCFSPVADSARYFVLASPAVDPDAAMDGAAPGVGLRPVNIPSYLNNPWLVVRTGNEINYQENLHWAEELGTSLLRTIGAHISNQLRTEKIYLEDWRRDSVDFEVHLQFLRFDTDPDGNATLAAKWRITSPGAGTVLSQGTGEYTASGPPVSTNPEEAVQVLGGLVGQLSSELVDRLRGLPRN